MVQPPILNFALAQLPGQRTVAIAIDLEPEGTPGRHPHVTQSRIRVDEIDVVVQAFAIIRLLSGSSGHATAGSGCRAPSPKRYTRLRAVPLAGPALVGHASLDGTSSCCE
jgi:hypothetical protein